MKPGNYHVVFFDKSTNTKLPLPIEIRPAAIPTSTGTKSSNTNTPGHPQSPGSIFAQGVGSSLNPLANKSLLGLAGVAAIAFLL